MSDKIKTPKNEKKFSRTDKIIAATLLGASLLAAAKQDSSTTDLVDYSVAVKDDATSQLESAPGAYEKYVSSTERNENVRSEVAALTVKLLDEVSDDQRFVIETDEYSNGKVVGVDTSLHARADIDGKVYDFAVLGKSDLDGITVQDGAAFTPVYFVAQVIPENVTSQDVGLITSASMTISPDSGNYIVSNTSLQGFQYRDGSTNIGRQTLEVGDYGVLYEMSRIDGSGSKGGQSSDDIEARVIDANTPLYIESIINQLNN